jgi:hypothetical protein
MSNLEKINIITLIEKDSRIRLSRDYQNVLINKIKESFSEQEQQLFVASFYCYLNYDSKRDFVIDFTDVWKWCGFTRKEEGKRLLKNHFVLDIDYKIENIAHVIGGASLNSQNTQKDVEEVISPPIGGKPLFTKNDEEKCFEETLSKPQNTGGRPKEKITLTVNAFKKFCMKAGTKKSDQIHDYYIKLEELLQETLKEQTNELQIQMEALLKTHKKLEENHKRLVYKQNRHKLKKGECFYIIQDADKLDRVKVGVTKNLDTRLSQYRISFEPIILYTLFSTSYMIIESSIKKKYEKNIVQGTEWIGNISLEDIIKSIEHISEFLGIEYTVYRTEEELIDLTEEDVVIENKTLELPNTPPVELQELKKCVKCQQEFNYTAFTKDITKKDNLSSICKACQKENKLAYKNKSRPEITEKICGICKEMKNVTNFSVHLYNKDGYVNNCYSCISIATNDKRKIDKENRIKYKCGFCEKDYTRKDVLQKHLLRHK